MSEIRRTAAFAEGRPDGRRDGPWPESLDDEPDIDHGMFPPKARYPRYAEKAVRDYRSAGTSRPDPR